MMTPVERDIQARIQQANVSRTRLWVRGAGTRSLIPPDGGSPLTSTGLHEVEELDVEELRVTAQAGCSLNQLRKTLDADELVVASLFGEAAVARPSSAWANSTRGGTVGGWYHDPRPIAALRWGRSRDQVLGVEGFRGDGTAFRAGGKVVKNVTGYDLTRLLCGSRGRLAMVRRLHLRLERRPEKIGWIEIEFDSESELWSGWADLRRSGLDPLGFAVEGRSRCRARVTEAGRAARVGDRLDAIARRLRGRERGREFAVEPPSSAASDSERESDAGDSPWRGHVHLGGRHWGRLLPRLESILGSNALRWVELFPDSGFGQVELERDPRLLPSLTELVAATTEYGGSVTPFRHESETVTTVDWPAPGEQELASALAAEWDPKGVLFHSTIEGPLRA